MLGMKVSMLAMALALAMAMAMAIKNNGRCHHEPPIFYEAGVKSNKGEIK